MISDGKIRLVFVVKSLLIIFLAILVSSSCTSNSYVVPYNVVTEIVIDNPNALFLLKEYCVEKDFLGLDSLFVLPGTEVFGGNQKLLEVVEEPNPFSPTTEFPFILMRADSVELLISNFDSSFIKEIYCGHLNAGYYGLALGECKLESGPYWMQFKMGEEQRKRKFILLR